MKAVNSLTKNTSGVAEDVEIKVGDWKGKTSFMSVPLDDFDIIIGLEFCLHAKVAIMPHLGGLLISEIKPGMTMEVPDVVDDVLGRFVDVMPSKLPPRQAVDHKIKLVLGARPPTQAPYRMAPLSWLNCASN